MSLAHRRKNTQTQRKTNTQDNTHKHEYADLIGQILRKVEASPQSQVLCCPTAVRNPWVGGWDTVGQWDTFSSGHFGISFFWGRRVSH